MNRFVLDRPTLILGAGIAGTGKSTTLKLLARMLVDAVYIDKDVINDSFLWKPKEGERTDVLRYHLTATGTSVPRSDPYYRNHVVFQSYHCMLMLARQALELGKHPIVDGNFIKEIRWGYIDSVLLPQFTDVDHAFKIVLMHASVEVVRRRIANRGADRDTDKLSDEKWQNLIAEQPIIPPEIEKYSHFKVDTERPLQTEDFERIIRFFRE